MAKRKDKSEQTGPATIRNRKAGYDYELLEKHEAGIQLVGSEVKSLYLGRANLVDAYCKIEGGELWLESLDIEPYDKASVFLPDRRRKRKLLMHKEEILKLRKKTEERGFSLIPTALYFKNGKVKVEIAIARGRKRFDKRDQIKAKDSRREAKDAGL